MSSKQDPKITTAVFKNSTITQAKEYARKLYTLNPTAYCISINDGYNDLYFKKL